MNTTVVTVDRVLLVHPSRLQLDAQDGTCVRWGCHETCPTETSLALVDYQFGVGYLPQLSPSGLVVVDPDRDMPLALDLCPQCADELDVALGWHCVPFQVEVET